MSHVSECSESLDSAAPLSARLPLASFNSFHSTSELFAKRSHRGHRSQIALLRRSLPSRCKALAGTTPGESGVDVPVVSPSILPQQSNNISNNISSSSENLENNISSSSENIENVQAESVVAKVASRTSRPKEAASRKHIFIYCINIRCVLSHLGELIFHLGRLKPHIVLLQETWLDKSVEQIYVPGYVTVSRRDRSETANRGGGFDFMSCRFQCSGARAKLP